MKSLLYLLLIPTLVVAEGITINPSIDTLTITCTYPTEREDNSPLAREDIWQTRFYRMTLNSFGVDNYTKFAENYEQCGTIITDFHAFEEGQNYITATVSDTNGQESVFAINTQYSKGAFAFVLDSLSSGTAIPKHPTNYTIQINL